MVRRGTARAGEAVFVSGTLGDAALGLALRKDAALAAAWGLTPAEAEHLRRRYARPEPRLALAGALRDHALAAMDISDGLAKDLARLCAASGCAARVRFADVPLSPAAAKRSPPTRLSPGCIVAGGDDYEVLAAVPAAQAPAVPGVRGTGRRYRHADRHGSKPAPASASRIATAARSSLERTGWDHF